MKSYGEITTKVVPGEGVLVVEVFSDDWMLGVWRDGYPDVWAFALSDKDMVREKVREELALRGRSF